MSRMIDIDKMMYLLNTNASADLDWLPGGAIAVNGIVYVPKHTVEAAPTRTMEEVNTAYWHTYFDDPDGFRRWLYQEVLLEGHRAAASVVSIYDVRRLIEMYVGRDTREEVLQKLEELINAK